ncbi:hypothetical protein [Pseudolabrys taiwanensis]|nr:hypothetical protein [Pseudolabrys taiwanensis]
MQAKRTTRLMACVLVNGAALYASTASADWHSPYFNRETHDSWTNAEYNDGVCHYRYSRDADDGETHVNRWGDCSHVAIAPDGSAVPIVAPVYAVPVPDDDD